MSYKISRLTSLRDSATQTPHTEYAHDENGRIILTKDKDAAINLMSRMHPNMTRYEIIEAFNFEQEER